MTRARAQVAAIALRVHTLVTNTSYRSTQSASIQPYLASDVCERNAQRQAPMEYLFVASVAIS